jgi:hypothetical protein
MAEQPRNPPTTNKAEKLANELQRIHLAVLTGLKDSQPLVVLSSLSLVIAAFASNVSSAAVSDAIAAFIAFTAALLFTVVGPPGLKSSVTFVRIQYSGLALVALVVGFFMLYLVAYDIAQKFSVASLIVRAFQFLLGAIVEVYVAVSATEIVSRLKRDKPEKWKPLRRYLVPALWGIYAAVTSVFVIAGFSFIGVSIDPVAGLVALAAFFALYPCIWYVARTA